MDITQIISLINSVGFPIFVSVYMMVNFQKIIENNTKVTEDLILKIQENTNALTQLVEKLNK